MQELSTGKIHGEPLSRSKSYLNSCSSSRGGDVCLWHKADIAIRSINVRLLGVKRTLVSHSAMSAFEPKRTLALPKSRNGRRYGISDSALLRPNVGHPDHLGPLLGFVGDKLAEVRRRACEYRAAEVSDPLGLASAHPGTRPPRSSTHSTRRSMRLSPIPR